MFFVSWLWFFNYQKLHTGTWKSSQMHSYQHTPLSSHQSAVQRAQEDPFCDKVNETIAQVTTAVQQWEPIADHMPALNRAAASQWFMVRHFPAHSACYHEPSDESSCSHLSVVAISWSVGDAATCTTCHSIMKSWAGSPLLLLQGSHSPQLA